MLLIYEDEQAWAALSDEERNPMFEEYFALTMELRERGVYVGGAPLQPTSTATAVRVRDGETLVTDGPFAETKDLIAGWMVIDVDSYERAVELAGELSAEPGAGGRPIHEWLEVRPFLTAPPTITE
jgi:hypothetical protein